MAFIQGALRVMLCFAVVTAQSISGVHEPPSSYYPDPPNLLPLGQQDLTSNPSFPGLQEFPPPPPVNPASTVPSFSNVPPSVSSSQQTSTPIQIRRCIQAALGAPQFQNAATPSAVSPGLAGLPQIFPFIG